MKKSKFIFIFFITMLCSSCSNINSSYITLIGYSRYLDTISVVGKELDLVINNDLCRQDGDYRMDYRMIDEEPIVHDEKGEHKSKELIENSDLVVFSYDINDVLANKKDATYDVEQKKKDYALFDYYLELTYDTFRDKYNNVQAIVLGIYEDDNSIYKGYIEEFNDVLLDKAIKYNMSFISTLFLSKYINDGNINEDGVAKLSKLIMYEYERKS